MGSGSITKVNQYLKRKELGLMKMELNSKIRRTNVPRYTVEWFRNLVADIRILLPFFM